jgi:2-oxoglutarate dehydrogenase E1 component
MPLDPQCAALCEAAAKAGTPFNAGDPLAVRLKRMTGLKDVVWCQEEPRNNGAWFYVNERIEDALTASGHTGKRPAYAGRDATASPATGLASRHKAQQEALVAAALGL